MTTAELVNLCEPLVGRPIPFNQWDCAIWWRDAAAALAKKYSEEAAKTTLVDQFIAEHPEEWKAAKENTHQDAIKELCAYQEVTEKLFPLAVTTFIVHQRNESSTGCVDGCIGCAKEKERDAAIAAYKAAKGTP